MRHHYVPKFLLRQWSFEDEKRQRKIPAFYWDARFGRLRRFAGGADAFCNQDALWELAGSHPDGRDALETNFFKKIDTSAARIVRKLTVRPQQKLTAQERFDFVVFLLSLEARRPRVVSLIKKQGSDFYREGFDTDQEITTLLRKSGSNETVSAAFERLSGAPIVDHALLLLQQLSQNERIVRKVSKYRWGTVHLAADQGKFVLGDRPLVRINATDNEQNLWALPLSPTTAFFASSTSDVEASLKSRSVKQIRNLLNSDSAMQCDRYVFCSEANNLDWLERRLRYADRQPGPEMISSLRPSASGDFSSRLP